MLGRSQQKRKNMVDFTGWKRCEECLKELHPECFERGSHICRRCECNDEKTPAPVFVKRNKNKIKERYRPDTGTGEEV